MDLTAANVDQPTSEKNTDMFESRSSLWENVTNVLVTMCLFWFNYDCGDNDPGQML